ncbi:hypothetical protein KLP40_14710 [Hymenobacter sp. NST-14]|uniref:hypothetical protein n=1 Tax=Hymenobacter piscis TaxID=2839984 RepID=UPI001C018536|nr:hypothetical protein [Hymenobacter piscis]MBT9394420.1 hypothetical protein [Hymenobacter piscis]
MLSPTAPLFPIGQIQVLAHGRYVPLPAAYYLYKGQLHIMSRQGLVPAGFDSPFQLLESPGQGWANPAEAFDFMTAQLELLRPGGQVGAWCIAATGQVTAQPCGPQGVTVDELVQWLDHHELYMQRVTAGPLGGWWVVVQEGAGTREWNYPALPVNPVGTALVLPAEAAGAVGRARLHGTVVVVSPQQWAIGQKKVLIHV